MPDDIRISDLSPVSAITNGALLELSNEDSGAETGYVSVKMTITQLATKLNVSMQYLTDLLTTNKTITGAINELNDKLKIGTSAPTSLMGNDGDFYLKYTEGTGGADDEVDAFYVKLDGVWCQISTGGGGGSGGHTILDNSGTALTQRANLQFKGAYSEDNSVDDITEVNVVRSMTKAQYNLLSADEKVGIINITDEEVTATDLPISSNDQTNIKSYIDGHIKSWTSLGYFQLDDNATGDWTLTHSVEGATDLLFFVSIDISGQPYDMPRNSMLVPAHILDNSGAIFYDFYVGSRTYFKLTKVSNTKFNISLTTGAGANTRIHAYCR